MESTQPKPFVFVLMPFAASFDDAYRFGIKAACADAGAYCERVDEQIFQESILDRIYNQISKADVLVADMTGRNANVFYETGYAHALGKQVILLTQNADDIPFDLKHYPHIIYGGSIGSLKDDLERRIRWALTQLDQGVPESIRIEFYSDGKRIVQGATVPVKGFTGKSRGGFLDLHLHNNSRTFIQSSSVQLSLITGDFSTAIDWGRHIIRLPDGRYFHLLSEPTSIYPDGWFSVWVPLGLAEDAAVERLIDQGGEAILRVSTTTSVQDLPIMLRLVREEEAAAENPPASPMPGA